MRQIKTKDMILAALLTALSVIITFFPKLPVPQPFSVTPASHVPTMIAAFISPVVTVLTVIGSCIGFMMSTGNVIVVLRAATHLIFALVGGWMLKRNITNKAILNYIIVIILTSVLHAGAEAAVVGWMSPLILSKSVTGAVVWVTFIGTLFHHYIDCIITVPVVIALSKAKLLSLPYRSRQR